MNNTKDLLHKPINRQSKQISQIGVRNYNMENLAKRKGQSEIRNNPTWSCLFFDGTLHFNGRNINILNWKSLREVCSGKLGSFVYVNFIDIVIVLARDL